MKNNAAMGSQMAKGFSVIVNAPGATPPMKGQGAMAPPFMLKGGAPKMATKNADRVIRSGLGQL